MRRKLFITAGFLFLVASFVHPPATVAAPSMGVSPSRREWSLQPGALRRGRFSISNSDRDAPISVMLSVMDISQGADGTLGLSEAGTTPWSAAGWVKLLKKKVTVWPGQSTVVGFDLSVPVEAKGGGYAAIVCQTSIKGLKRTGTTVTTVLRIPHMIYVTVKGTDQPKADIVKVTAAGAGEKGMKLLYTLKNLGNVFFRPSGSLDLDCGGKRRHYNANPRQLGLMPGFSRVYEISDEQTLPVTGTCQVKLKLEYGSASALESTGDVALTP
jgi:hypothetical protein